MRVEHPNNWQFFLQARLPLVVQTVDNSMELTSDYRRVWQKFKFQLPDRFIGSW
jgi:hypothetical protein